MTTNNERVTIEAADCNPESAAFIGKKEYRECVSAFEIGVSVLNRVQASADMDFVKGQVDALLATVKGALGVMVESTSGALSEMRSKYGEDVARVTAENFNPDLPTSYPKRFGDYLNAAAAGLKDTVSLQLQQVKTELARVEQNTSESESSLIGRARKIVSESQEFIQKQFDGTNTSGFAFKLAEQLEQLTGGIDEAVRKSIEDKLRAEMDLALKPINDQLIVVREALAKEAGKAELYEKSTGKGFDFEDELFERLQAIAQPFGDSVEKTGLTKEVSGSQKGDFLYMTAMKQLIVVEAKDKPVMQRESLDYMKLALEARGSRFGILVAKLPDQLQKQIGRWNMYDNSIVICCEDDVEVSIRCLRLVAALQSVQTDGINAGVLQAKVDAVTEAIKRLAEVKKNLTNMQRGVSEGSERIVAVVDEVRSQTQMALLDIETEIRKTARSAA